MQHGVLRTKTTHETLNDLIKKKEEEKHEL